MEVDFLDDNPIPRLLPFNEQLRWYQQLLDAEHNAGTSTQDA